MCVGCWFRVAWRVLTNPKLFSLINYFHILFKISALYGLYVLQPGTRLWWGNTIVFGYFMYLLANKLLDLNILCVKTLESVSTALSCKLSSGCKIISQNKWIQHCVFMVLKALTLLQKCIKVESCLCVLFCSISLNLTIGLLHFLQVSWSRKQSNRCHWLSRGVWLFVAAGPLRRLQPKQHERKEVKRNCPERSDVGLWL